MRPYFPPSSHNSQHIRADQWDRCCSLSLFPRGSTSSHIFHRLLDPCLTCHRVFFIFSSMTISPCVRTSLSRFLYLPVAIPPFATSSLTSPLCTPSTTMLCLPSSLKHHDAVLPLCCSSTRIVAVASLTPQASSSSSILVIMKLAGSVNLQDHNPQISRTTRCFTAHQSLDEMHCSLFFYLIALTSP